MAITTSSYHVEDALMLSKSRSPDASSGLRGVDIEPRATCESMLNRVSANQIGAVVDWNAGEVFIAGNYEEEIRVFADYGRVRDEA